MNMPIIFPGKAAYLQCTECVFHFLKARASCAPRVGSGTDVPGVIPAPPLRHVTPREASSRCASQTPDGFSFVLQFPP